MSVIQELIVKFKKNPNTDTYRSIIKRIQTADKLWTAVSSASGNYYLGNENGGAAAYIFSEREYAEKYAEHMKEKGIGITIAENKKEYRMLYFGDIYRSGFDTVVMDNGQTYLRMNLFDIINKPNAENLPKESRYVINPDLVRTADWFYQENEKGQAAVAVWASLFKEIYNGEYIVPANTSKVKMEVFGKEFIVDKESEVLFPLVKNEEGQTFYPFFTDWNEFRKYDVESKYSSLVGGFDDMKKLVKKADGVVINPYGANLIITSEMLGNIENAGKNASAQSEKMTLGIPKERPLDVEEKVAHALDGAEGVHSASIKLADTNGKKKFIIYIDCDDIKAAAQKLGGLQIEHKLPIEFIFTGHPLAKSFGDVQPFYSA